MDGGGGVVTFEIDGAKKEAFSLKMRSSWSTSPTIWATTKSIITHPATTTHSKLKPEARAELGISDGMMRLSVGLEDPADICEDLELALAKL